jgi:hypothetical protein
VGLTALVAGACGGARVLNAAAEFVRTARSVRLQVKDHAAGPVRHVEIVCPDRVRVTAEGAAGRLELLAVGDEAFGRIGTGDWIQVPLSLVGAPPICRGARWHPGAQDLTTLLQAISQLAVSERPVGPREVSGVACQDWEARDRAAGAGVPGAIVLCLGTVDKRPMEITLPDATWTFAEWNAEVTIDPPPAVKGQAAAVSH